MSNLIHPDAALIPILARVTADDMLYKLFSNNFTPDRDSELADFTESAGTGYADVTLSSADWVHDSVTAHNASRAADDISFICSSGTYTVYGYYITDSGETELLGFVLFTAPVVVTPAEPLIISPKWGDVSKYAA